MSRHTAYRLNLTQKAILATVLGFGTINAQAVSLGQPTIQSGQNEPLSATIEVTGIDANAFEASIASNAIYAQMGLTQTGDIKAQFVRTSDTSGKIILTSGQPINMPFADIVLNLHNKGEQIIEPQTLLMPMGDHYTAEPIGAGEMPLIADHEPNLPVTNSDTELSPYSVPETPAYASSIHTDENGSSPYSPLLASKNTDEALRVQNHKKANSQLGLLTDEITGKVYAKGDGSDSPEHLPMNIAAPDDTAAVNSSKNSKNKKSKTKPDDLGSDNPDQQDDTEARYVVQSGDTLWGIATQIARANKLSIDEVMTALHKQNPDAFSQGKINRLKAGANLSIPAYEVIPSQKAIQEAISARRSASSARTPSKARSTKAAKAINAKAARPKTVVKTLPRPQVTLVTPSAAGSSMGSSTAKASERPTIEKAVNSSASSDGQLINALKTSRNQAAQNAKRVNGLNQELSSASQRLQLQNQKLAELEARLKALKEKQ